MPASVICLSHTEGAGGEEIGRSIAEQLGFRYADESIVADVARAERLLPEAVARAESSDAGRSLEVDFGRVERTEHLRALIREAIVETADDGSVVIVAHAASYALAGREGVLRVLVTASDEARTRTIAGRLGLDGKRSARHLVESDKGRAAYLQHFYGVKHELPSHYDLVISTDRLTPEQAASAVCAAART